MSELVQRQSRSINDNGTVTIALGSIFTNNTGNTNNFATDRSFVVFGDDNGSMAWTPTGAPASRQVLGRTYKVSETGSDTADLMIAVPDNSSTLTGRLPGEANSTVYLLVDADGDFSA